MKETILVVAHNPKNVELLSQFFEKQGYQTATASSLSEFDALVKEETPLNLALIDITGFDKSIWDRCEILRKMRVPFFIIFPKASEKAQDESISRGAKEAFVKPLSKDRLLKIVKLILGS